MDTEGKESTQYHPTQEDKGDGIIEELDGNFFRRSTVDNKRINPSNELAFDMQKSRDERLMSDN